ncbi:MAG: carbohydrate-binding domain-containing protein [Solobacterium sp.]|nr:carbohydrate-binding domain-containing protein [Solobacterium sp.]
MKKHISCIPLAALMVFSGCNKSEISSEMTDSNAEETATTAVSSASVAGSADILCDGTNINANDASVKTEGGTITITKPGTYSFTGNLTGSIVVNSPEKGDVVIVLNGLSIQADQNAGIFIQEADNTILEIAEGSENVITDATEYVLNEDGDPTAAIFCKDDLVIQGKGKLIVNGNYNDGITCKDDLKIIDTTTIEVNAKDDGIIGKDSLYISNANIKISCEGDALKASNDTDENKGTISIDSGTVEIHAGDDGIQSVSAALIYGGDITIFAGEGAATAGHKDNGFGGFAQWGQGRNDDQNEEESSESQKGITSDKSIEVHGGTITIDSTDDAFNSAGTIVIEEGTMVISAGDDAFHADQQLMINNGNIDIQTCYEGLESLEVTVNGGEISIVALDDGINASNPDVKESMMSDGSVLNINGGSLSIDADGDGFDSNGDVYMTGGAVTVYGPENNGNGAMDYAGSFTITGGTLLAGGSTGMLQVPAGSDQVYVLSIVTNGGSTISIQDASGNDIATYTSKKKFGSLVYASDALKEGETYAVYEGDTEIGEVTISDRTSYINTSAMQGGMRPQDDRGQRPDGQGQMPGDMPADGERPDDFGGQGQGDMPHGGPGAPFGGPGGR